MPAVALLVGGMDQLESGPSKGRLAIEQWYGTEEGKPSAIDFFFWASFFNPQTKIKKNNNKTLNSMIYISGQESLGYHETSLNC